ncbi:MAG: CpsD/CapB family tyrosine-protein kinase [Candidatus Krumholzibacteriia bacterium]
MRLIGKAQGVLRGSATRIRRALRTSRLQRHSLGASAGHALALLGLAGALVGLGLALRRRRRPRAMRTPSELEAFPALTVLGGVPHVEAIPQTAEPGAALAGHAGRADGFPLLIQGSRTWTLDPSSLAAESYRSLRTSLYHIASRGLPRTLLVTSPGPREGKTTTALNVALCLALSGVQTCLVDADLRRPQLHRAFGHDLDPGLANHLEGLDLPEPFERVTPHANLSIVTAGRSTENPAELLGGPRIGTLLGLLSQRHRAVILDAPPLLPVADASILAPCVDRVLLVACAQSTRFEAIERALHVLRGVGIQQMHAVLNAVRLEDDDGNVPGYIEKSDGGSGDASAV